MNFEITLAPLPLSNNVNQFLSIFSGLFVIIGIIKLGQDLFLSFLMLVVVHVLQYSLSSFDDNTCPAYDETAPSKENGKHR